MTKQQAPHGLHSHSFFHRNAQRWLFALLAFIPLAAWAAPELEVVFDPAIPGSFLPGDTKPITLTFSNTSTTDAATNAVLTLSTLPPGVTVKSGSRSCTASSGSSCGTLGSGGALYSGGNIAANGSLSISAELEFIGSATGDKTIAAIGSADGVTSALVTHTFNRTPNTDLEISITPEAIGSPDNNCPGDAGTYTPGCKAGYNVVVKNNGPDAAPGATLSIFRTEAPTEAIEWTCSATNATCPSGAGSGLGPMTAADIPAFVSGGMLTLTVTVVHGTQEAHVGAGISAEIAPPAGMVDISPGNNAAASSPSRTRKPAANLAASVTATTISSPETHCPGGADVYTPGCVATYSVEFTNTGPDDVVGATLSLRRTEFASAAFGWGCEASAGAACPDDVGIGAFSGVTASIPKNEVLTYSISVMHSSADLYEAAGITAVIDPPTGVQDPIDINLTNNTASASRTIDRRAALRVVKRAVQNEAPITQVAANDAFDYEITVYNDGPSDVGNTETNSPDPLEPPIPSIDPAGPALVLSDVFDPLLVGVAGDCGPASGKPCWRLCPSTLGNEEVEGSSVGDTTNCLADIVTGSSGQLTQRFALRAGTGSRLFTRVNVPSVTSVTPVSNTASVSLSSCSGGGSACKPITLLGVPADQSSEVTVDISPSLSAQINVASITSNATPGMSHSYTITVKNTGKMHLPRTSIVSSFPLADGGALGMSGFVPGTVRYQCSAQGTAVCFVNGASGQTEPTEPVLADALAVESNIPQGGQVEFTVTGMLDPRATGAVILPAEATPAAGVDPVTGSATATMMPQFNLNLSKRLIQRSEDELPRLSYEITASNDGPSFAAGVKLADGADTNNNTPNFNFSGATWDCTAHPAPASGLTPESTQCGQSSGSGGIGDSGAAELLLDLMPGSRAVVQFHVSVTEVAGDQVENKATLFHPDDGTKQAIATTNLRANYRLEVQKDDGLTVAHPGSAHEYAITVLNQGPDDAYDVRVQDAMPSALQNVQWTCSALSPVPGDLEALQDTVGPLANPGTALTLSRDGRHAYVLGHNAEGAGTLWAYYRNATPGKGYGEVAFSPIDIEVDEVDDPSDTGSAVAGMGDPIDLALTPDGSVLYVLSATHVVAFHRSSISLDPEFGRLSFAGATAVSMSHPRRLVVSGTNIYVAGSTSAAGSGKVEVYRPDSNNQLPVLVAGGTVNAPDGAGPMVLDAMAAKLFVASTTTSTIQRYSVVASGPDKGKLTPDSATGSSEAGFIGIHSLVMAPNGQDLYLFAKNGGNPRIGHVKSSSAAVSFGPSYGQNSAQLLSGSGAVRLALAPDGEHLIGVNPSKSSLFSIRRNTLTGALSGGDLTYPDVEQWLTRDGDPGSGTAIGLDAPMAALVTPDNRHVLVVSGSNTPPIGPLTILSRRAPAPQLGFIEHDRHGDAIESTQEQIDSMTAPADVATRGSFVYVLSKQDSAINLFKRQLSNTGVDEDDGRHLTFVRSWRNGQGGVTGMSKPDRLLISPNGESLFVSSVDGDSLAVFRRSGTNGELAFAGSFKAAENTGLKGAYGMAMNRSGKHLYVAGSFASSIAIFAHDGQSQGRLTYQGVVVGGQNGVTGMNGIRDLVVAGDDNRSQLIGVSDAANSVVVFNRNKDNGQLTFVQALNLGANQRPVALALSPDVGIGDNAHVYVAAQNSNSVHVLQRVLDSSNPQFGRVRLLASVSAGGLAPSRMTGPRDVAVSDNGKRVYVAAQYGSSLVAFDRYDSPGSALYGQLTLAEVRTQDIDAVAGISEPYAVAVSADSRNVYVAGFNSNSVASFSVGTGSTCSASGSGDIDDLVTIRAGGAVMYTVQSTIRVDATGTLSNTVTVVGEKDTVTDTDNTALLTSARLELTKTNNQVSVTPGTEVTYDLTVRNTGPGNVSGLDDPSLANVTDLFGCTVTGPGTYDCSASPFDEGSISWTCAASSSGVLDFMAAYHDGDAGIAGLGGVSSLARIPAGQTGDGHDVLDNFLVAASVDDGALVFFHRDMATGALSYHSKISHSAATPLLGARSVSVSDDGRLLFAVSRQSDALVVFELSGHPGSPATGNSPAIPREPLIITPKAVAKSPLIKGLDQALHVIALPAGGGNQHVYIAGANDHAVAAFTYNTTSATLTHVGSWVDGVAGVLGLTDVEYLIASPDGAQVYALSGSGGSVAQFNRAAGTGELTYVARFGSGALGVPLTGVSSGDFDANGRYLYLTASTANRLVVLKRVTASGAGDFGSLSLVTSVGQGEQGTQGLNNPRRAAMTADGQHLYVTSQAASTLAWFSLHPETGVPSYQGIRSNFSAGVEGLAGATGLVIDPELNQIYVAGNLARAITHFQRQSDSWCPPSGTGLLDSVPVNIAAGGQVQFRLTARISSELVGNLVNVADVEWQSADCEGGAGTTMQACDVTDEDIDLPSSLADLSITKSDGLAEFDGLAGAIALAADARNVYVAAPGDNAIGMFQRQYSIATGVGLTYLGALRSGAAGVSGLAGVRDIVASADGRHVYAVSPTDNAIASFSRDASDGRLSQIDLDQNGLLGVTGLSGARAVTMSADGAHVYVAGEYSNSIAIFRRQVSTGAADFGKLSFVTSIQAGVGGINGIEAPRALTLSADGKHLYVLSDTTDSVVAFSRQTNSGSGNYGLLTQVGRYQNTSGGVLGMDNVRSLALSSSGEHLYVLGAEAGSLVHFARNAGDGTLSFVPHTATEAVLLMPELVGAARVRMANDGQMYVAAKAQDAIAVIEFDAAGKPELVRVVKNGDASTHPSAGLVDGLTGVADVAVVHDGPQDWFLYAGAAQDDALSEFDLDAGVPGYLGTVFDGMGGVAPGDTVTYLIVVKNHGPSDVQTARVVDQFPPEFEQLSWTCSGYAGGACPLSGTGNIDMGVTIPNGGQVQIEASGVVRADAAGRLAIRNTGGRLINTATVEAVGVLDPNMSNNSATDDDTVMSPSMDLSISVDDNGCELADPGCVEVTEATPGGDIRYFVEATNAGPTYAKAASVSDTLPAALYDVSWTCTPVPQAGLLSEITLTKSEVDIAYRAAALDALGAHVYAVGTRSDINGVRDTVVVFKRDQLTGALSRLKSYSTGDVTPLLAGAGNAPPVRGIDGAIDIAMTSDGRFIYVAGQNADAIALFARDPATGLLEWRAEVVDGEMGVQGIGGISTLELSPDGRHLYAGAAAGQAIAGFRIEQTNGTLAQVSVIRQSDAGVNGLNGVTDLAFDDSGTHLFVTARENRSVTAFKRTSSSGVLAYLAGIEDGQVGVNASLLSPSALAVYGDRVFVADAQGDAINLLRFVAGDTPKFELDELIELDSDGLPSTQQPVALAYVADQSRLYVASAFSNEVHLYSLLGISARHVESVGTSTSLALEQVSAMVLAPERRQLYVISSGVTSGDAGGNGLIAALARELGSRCPLDGEGALGTQRVDIAAGGSVLFDVSGRIFANAAGTLTYSVSVDPRTPAFEINPENNRDHDTDTLIPAPDLETGKLRLTDTADVIAGLPVAYQIDVINHGVSDALAARVVDEVPLFPVVTGGLLDGSENWTCAANEPLALDSSLTSSTEPRIADISAMAHTPDGLRWFGVSRSGNALVELRLDANQQIEQVARWVDGDSAGGSIISGLAGASHLAVSPEGTHLYVSAAASDSVLVFGIGATELVFLQKLTSGQEGVAGLRGAAYVVVSGDGNFVYVAAVPNDMTKSAIALFSRDHASGELQFEERIQDGMGTFKLDSNVIRGVKRLHLSADGRHMVAVSTGSQTLARFDVNQSTGTLTYAGVLRGATGNGGTVLPELAGVRDLISTPGDTQLYVLAEQGIVLFDRALNGSLSLVGTWTDTGGSASRALGIDTWGSRLYQVDVDGTVHLYARLWSNGFIEHRFSLVNPLVGDPGALLHVPALGEVLLTQVGAGGGLSRLVEQPISRCLTPEGSNADLPAPIDLGVEGTSQILYAATVHPSARGTLRNVARTEPGGSGIDPNPANDESFDEVQILVQSDLSIEKTGPETAVAGEYIDYVITVRNAGPSDALGIRVRDDLGSTKFVDATWTCEASGDSHCTHASGAGATLDAEADLLVGDEITVRLNVKVHSAWLGALTNAAFVIPEADSVDPTPGDQVATPVDTIVVRRADLVVSKSTSVAEVVAGSPVAYTITVYNAGPSDAPDVSVRDTLPAGLRDAHWACLLQLGVGDCGALTGAGSINQQVSIPVGETLTFQLDAMLSPAAEGTLTNTARASVLEDPAGDVLDPDTDNNTATVEDPVLQRADLSLTVIAPDAYDPDSPVAMPYRIEVNNLGPSNAALSVVVAKFNHPVTLSGSACTPQQGTQFSCSIDSLAAGAMATIDFGLRDLPSVPATLNGNLSIGSQTDDPVSANNTANSSTEMRTGVDLDVTVDDGRDGLAPGDSTIYTIRIRNVGSVDAVDARVLAPQPIELVDASWFCTAPAGVTCTVLGTGDIDALITLPAGKTMTYTLSAMLDPALDVMAHDEVEQTVEVVAAGDQVEVSAENNTDSDINIIYKVIFRDGFEDPPAPRAPLAALQDGQWLRPQFSPVPDAVPPLLAAHASALFSLSYTQECRS